MNLKKFVEKCKQIVANYEEAVKNNSLEGLVQSFKETTAFRYQIYAEVKQYRNTHCKKDFKEIEYYENLLREDNENKYYEKLADEYEEIRANKKLFGGWFYDI